MNHNHRHDAEKQLDMHNTILQNHTASMNINIQIEDDPKPKNSIDTRKKWAIHEYETSFA